MLSYYHYILSAQFCHYHKSFAAPLFCKSCFFAASFLSIICRIAALQAPFYPIYHIIEILTALSVIVPVRYRGLPCSTAKWVIPCNNPCGSLVCLVLPPYPAHNPTYRQPPLSSIRQVLPTPAPASETLSVRLCCTKKNNKSNRFTINALSWRCMTSNDIICHHRRAFTARPMTVILHLWSAMIFDYGEITREAVCQSG